MKKILSLSLIVVLMLSTGIVSFAAGDTSTKNPSSEDIAFKEVVTEVVEEKETIICEEVVSTNKVTKTKEIVPMYQANEKTFSYTGYKTNRIKLYGIDYDYVKIPVGTSDIDLYYKWTETWMCDEYGNKRYMISSTPRLIYKAIHEYHSIAGFDVWRNSWDPGIGTTKARAEGDVKSKLGTHSWTHIAYTN